MHSACKYMTYSSSNNGIVHGEKCTSPALLLHLHHTHSQKSPTIYAIHHKRHLISKVTLHWIQRSRRCRCAWHTAFCPTNTMQLSLMQPTRCKIRK